PRRPVPRAEAAVRRAGASLSPYMGRAKSGSRLGLAARGFLCGGGLALLALLLGLGLLGVVARRALGEPGRIEEARHAVGRLRTHAQPMLDALGVELHPLGVVLGQQRIVRAHLLDVAAVAR